MVALFGYEVSSDVNMTEATLQVVNGFLNLSGASATYHAGRHSLAFSVVVQDLSLLVSISVGSVIQTIDANAASWRCPNISLSFVVSYPHTIYLSNLTEEVHQIYSTAMMYPFDLLQTMNATAKRVAGDVQVTLSPGTGISPFVSLTLLQSHPLPENTNTGAPSSQQLLLLSTIPSTGGIPVKVPVSIPAQPPGLSLTAKGAIAICVLVAVLIIMLGVTGVVVARSAHHDMIGSHQSDKSVRKVTNAQTSDLAKVEMVNPLSPMDPLNPLSRAVSPTTVIAAPTPVTPAPAPAPILVDDNATFEMIDMKNYDDSAPRKKRRVKQDPERSTPTPNKSSSSSPSSKKRHEKEPQDSDTESRRPPKRKKRPDSSDRVTPFGDGGD